ncbi:hypothetical protein HMPREF9964_1237 [Streptococcus dysgalactiae subsp. equisimilis SK1249]|nr:hypothetical protein HMPREF9964_1237 [Streptococcus dysgalactiae subsp. equisimilis SK1249]
MQESATHCLSSKKKVFVSFFLAMFLYNDYRSDFKTSLATFV